MALLLGLSMSVPPAAAAATDPTVYWTGTAGPVAIPGKTWGLVAALPLPKGRFHVSATATLIGRADSPNIRQQVACRLILGSRKDQILASPSRSDRGGSRMSLLLTVSGRLKSPASARVRCYGGDRRDDVRIRDIRISAVKAGRLTLQDGLNLGAKRTNIGSGSPRIISASGAGIFVPGDSAYHEVGSLALPAGRWWLTAKAVARAAGAPGTESGGQRCRLVAGVDHDDLMFGLASGASPATSSIVPLALQVVHRFRTPASIVLECRAPTVMAVSDVAITALKAGRLTNIPLEAAVGTSTGQGSPRVISGWANGPVDIPVRATYKTIRSLELPKGRWTVLAKLWFAAGGSILSRPAANGVARTYCRLAFGKHTTPTQLRYVADSSATAPLVLSVNHRATSPQKVKLQCRRANAAGGGDAYFIKITALRAGSLVRR